MRARTLPIRVIGAAIAIFAVVAPAPPAGAAPASACTAKSGVTVIVDFSSFHLDIERGCAPGRPPSALAALNAAGFGTAGTAQYGDAFVCRINGLPSKAKESCARTPPARASWAFYSAGPADTQWTYATTAVTMFRPPSGSIVAFAFGNYAKPGIRPTAAIASPATTTTTPPPTTTSGSTTTPTVSAQTASTTTVTPTFGATAASAPPATARSTTSIAQPVAGAPTTTSERAPRVVNRTAAGTGSGDSPGSPLPAALTVALVAILGVGGWVTVSARRRSST